MAYAHKMTNELSPLALEWYDVVRQHLLAKWPKAGAKIAALFENAEKAVLQHLQEMQQPPTIAADYFHWLVALNVFILKCPKDDFPLQEEEPPHFGEPCSQAYVEHWYARGYEESQMAGPVTLVPAGAPLSSLEVRERLARRIHRVERAGESLIWKLPPRRRRNVVLGLVEHFEVQLKRAEKLLGPEFLLALWHGGGIPTEIILSLRPGVNADDLGVVHRTRLAVDLLDAWYADVCKYDCNLVEHLEGSIKRTLKEPDKKLREDIEASEVALRKELPGSALPAAQVEAARKAQERWLEANAYQKVWNLVQEKDSWMDKVQVVHSFIEDGHEDVVLLDKADRARICYRLHRFLAEMWVTAKLEDVDDGKETLDHMLSLLTAFVRDGHSCLPFLTNVADRMRSTSAVLLPWAAPNFGHQLRVQDALMTWNSKLKNPLPEFKPIQESQLAKSLAASNAETASRKPTASIKSRSSGTTVRAPSDSSSRGANTISGALQGLNISGPSSGPAGRRTRSEF
ncbi:putative SRCR domain-containing protein [Seiridium cardinale]